MRPRRTTKPPVDPGLVADGGFPLPDKLLATFSGQSTIGFGICDRQLRFQALNNVLAITNGIAAEAHLGRTVREILGDVAGKIEPAFERVLVTRKPVLKQVTGKLLTRPEVVHWIASYFPVKDSAGKSTAIRRSGGRSHRSKKSTRIACISQHTVAADES